MNMNKTNEVDLNALRDEAYQDAVEAREGGMKMINVEHMKRLFVRNLLEAISMTMKGFAFIAAVSSVLMLYLVVLGEFAFLHVFAMMGIAGAFGVMAAVADAVRDSVNI